MPKAAACSTRPLRITATPAETSPTSTVAAAIVASNTALLKGRSGNVVDVVEVLVELVEVVLVEVVVLVDVLAGATVVVLTGSLVTAGVVAVEPDVAAVGSDLLVADANATVAIPTTPTIQTRLAMDSILAGLQPRTTAPGPSQSASPIA